MAAQEFIAALSDRAPGDRELHAVLVVTALGMVARLFALGHRVAQWDEGRVAYWVLRYEATGYWEYRPIVHGPFLFHVDKWVFSLVGANDFTLRLVVAVVGGSLPLAAWLFRTHLDSREMVALAGLLAFNPLLLYYSRFFRNDVLVASFATLALGLFLRASETRSPRYLYGGAALLALSFTAKENAVLYPVCWIGAGVILLDHRLYRAGASVLGGDGASVATDGGSADDDASADDGGADGTEDERTAVEREESAPHDGDRGDTPSPTDTEGSAGGVRSSEARQARPASAHDRSAGNDYGTDTVPTPDPGRSGRSPDSGTGPDGAYTDRPWPTDGTAGDGFDLLKSYLRSAFSFGRVWWPHLVLSAVLFLAVLVFFYAPRASEPGRLGLYNALTNPGMLPDVVDAALLGSWDKFQQTWGPSSGLHKHAYMPFLKYFLTNIPQTAAVTVSFAVVGFLADRYRGEGGRDIVALATYWGVASLFGYPMVTDIRAPWTFVHVIVPLMVPAAVGLAVLWELSRDAITDRDLLRTGITVALALLVVGWTAGVAYDVNYANSDARRIDSFAHWTQPDNDLKHTLAKVEAVSEVNEGTDVLFYGTTNPANRNQVLFYMANESYADRPPAEGGFGWYARLPLPWYMERFDANTTSTKPGGNPTEKLENAPPVVIAYDYDRDEVSRVLEGYVAFEHAFKLWGERIVVFIDCGALERANDGHGWDTACPGPDA